MLPELCKAIMGLACLSVGAFSAQPALSRRICEPVPGLDALLSRTEVRILLFGELHGTVEIPQFFGDVVCHATTSGRPIVVGVEYGEHEQADLDRFMQSSASEYDPPGRPTAQDGRYSRAMTDLLIRLRALRDQGAQLRVVAFRRSWLGSKYRSPDAAMAAALKDHSKTDANALVIALVGSVHASKSREALGIDFTPAGGFLDPGSTVTLNTTYPGGQAWNCSPHCRANPRRRAGLQLPRGVHLTPSVGFDGRFSAGVPFSASPPSNPPIMRR